MTTPPASYHGDLTAGFPASTCRWWRCDLPEPPARWSGLIGPGVIATGVGIASGEFLLILINRRRLPAPAPHRVGRTIALLWSFVLFGVLAGLTFAEQIPTCSTDHRRSAVSARGQRRW